VALVVGPAFVTMGLACGPRDKAAELPGAPGALLAFGACEGLVDAVGEEIVAFCRLAPCALKAERKLPKNGLLVVGMFAIGTVLR